jgi:hypothetical protein
MIWSLLRSIGSVLAGLIMAFVFIIAAEVICGILHPFPPGADTNNMEVIKDQVRSYPTWVLALGAAIWAAAPFAGAWLATRLGAGRHPAHGYVVGAILLALAGCNVSMLPYPTWFPIVVIGTFLLGTVLGTRLGRGPGNHAGGASRKEITALPGVA